MPHPCQRAIFELRAIFHKFQMIIDSSKMRINTYLINKLIYWFIWLWTNIQLTSSMCITNFDKNYFQKSHANKNRSLVRTSHKT